MDFLARTVVLGLLGSAICLVIRRESAEMSFILALTVSLLILALAIQVMGTILDFTETLRVAAELSPAVVRPVLKTVGIAILTHLAADICRDAGQAAIASAVELTGTVAALYIALPLMQTVFEMIGGLL